MSHLPPRDDDQAAVLSAIGPAVPILFREAVEHGFFNYAKSRALDPAGHAEHSECSRANVLYDRIAAVARGLVDASGSAAFRWKIGDNKRATEIELDPHFAFRIKREKENRDGRTTSVDTSRQRRIKSRPPLMVIGQMVLPFLNKLLPMTYAGRLWLTVSYDLDEFEESVSKIAIGVERRKGFLWKFPIPEAEPAVIATLHPSLAAQVMNLRQLRSA